MLKTAIALFLLVVLGCQSLPQHTGSEMEADYQIINLESDFKEFWHKANSKSFAEQLTLWDETIESKHPGFYRSLVWSQKDFEDWELRKREKLRRYFKIYSDPKQLSIIENNFRTFARTLNEQIGKYQKIFPDAQFRLPIYAAPTAGSFNGRAGNLESAPEKTILAFGIDTIIKQQDDSDVLYSHELFHIYHVGILDLNEAKAISADMTLPLWLEGLATYSSSLLNPNATESAILLDKELPTIREKELSWLASEFLKISKKKAWASGDPRPYQAWFGIEKERPRADLPARCGYLLGLEVARQLGKTHDLGEMTKWDIGQSRSHVIEALKFLARQ